LRRKSSSKISVLLASDIPMFRSSVMKLLDHVLPFADVNRPQVAVLDLDVAWHAIHELARGLLRRNIPTLLMSDTIDDAIAVELVQSGVSGVINRRTSPELLCKSLCAVTSGEIWVSRQIISNLVRHVQMLPRSGASGSMDMPARSVAARTFCATASHSQSVRPPNRYGLTRRELQVVQALGDGRTNKEIATQLAMSEHTVKHHLGKIFDRVGVHSRLELVMFATHKGLVAASDQKVALVA
jgi:two-component system nitrate/nitrite response regulator NarL